MKGQKLFIVFLLLQVMPEVFAHHFKNQHFSFAEHKGRYQWEIRSDINEYFSYRLSGYKNDILIRRQQHMVEHNATFNNAAVASMLDWHPLKGNFRITAGLFITTHELEFFSEPVVDYYFPGATIGIDKSRIPEQISYDAQSIELDLGNSSQHLEVGGEIFEIDLANLPDTIDVEAGIIEIDINQIPDQIVIDPIHVQINREDINVTGRLKFKPVAPYLGFGWSNKPGSSSRLRFGVDVGLMYHGSPELDMQLNGRILDVHPRLTTYLNEEFTLAVSELKTKTDEYKFLPYASIGLSIQL